MRVVPTNAPRQSMPDYYQLYTRWMARAKRTHENRDLQEAYRFARLAEEFGQALIEDDTTQDDFLPE